MRFTPKDDKELNRNLKTLLVCSKFKSLKIASRRKEALLDEINFLNRDELFEYKAFLEQAYIANPLEGEGPFDGPVPVEILSVYSIKEGVEIPEKFIEQNSIHTGNVSRMELLDRLDEEQKGLREILYNHKEYLPNSVVSNAVNLQELRKYLRNPEHSQEFQEFSKKMRTGNSYSILRSYKSAARALAKQHNIDSHIFIDKLDQAFTLNSVQLDLSKELRKKLTGKFLPATMKISAIALAGTLSLNGLINIVSPDTQISQGTVGSHSTYTEEIQTPDSTEGSTIKEDKALPISNSIKIDSYDSAGRDFLQKAEEIYYYNTGEKISLSDLSYKNINQGNSTVYQATLGDKTITFSAMSEFKNNKSNLEKALTAIGATVTSYDTKLTFLTRDGKSIAICDPAGNPIRSGKVLEQANSSGYEMYNQSYINTAKELMQENGINPKGKSEAELIGYYLFNGPSEQNDELSRALGELTPLADYMKSTFPYGKDDPYAVYVYSSKSHALGDKINNEILGTDEQVRNGDRELGE